MNNNANKHLFPNLIEDVLSAPGQHVDNVFSTVWKNLNVNKLIEQAGFKKRTGLAITESVFY